MEGELYEEEGGFIPVAPPLPEGTVVPAATSESGAADFHATGGSKELKSWERAWNLKELRQIDTKWSLAADAGVFIYLFISLCFIFSICRGEDIRILTILFQLYHYLEEFSHRLLDRTKATQTAVDDLVDTCAAATISTQNVFNEFLLLSNSQFIENVRVVSLSSVNIKININLWA